MADGGEGGGASGGEDGNVAVLGLDLDSSNFKSGADEAAESSNTLKQNVVDLGSALDKAQDSIKEGLSALGLSFGLLKTGEAIQQSIELASRYNELGSVMQRLGSSAGYTSSEINQQEAAMEKMGIGMQTARQSIVKMEQANIDLSNATKLAAISQNLAVAGNKDVGETMNAVIRGVQTGNAFILRRSGINVDWTKSEVALAAQLGKTKDELTDNEKEQARMNAIVEATKQLNGAWAASMETSGGQMRLLTNEAQEFKIKLGQTLEPAFITGLKAMGEAFQFVGSHLNIAIPLFMALASRGLIPLISMFTRVNASTKESVVAFLSSGTAASRLAAQELAAAAAIEKESIANLESAKIAADAAAGTAQEAATLRQLALAQNEAAAASGRATNATLRNIEAQKAANLAASAGEKSMIGLKGALNFLGGAPGVAIMALAAAFTWLSEQMNAGKEMADKYPDLWDQESVALRKLEEQLNKTREAKDKLFGANPERKDAQDSEQKTRNAIGIQLGSAFVASATAASSGNVVDAAKMAKDGIAIRAITDDFLNQKSTLEATTQKLADYATGHKEAADFIDRLAVSLRDLAATQKKEQDLDQEDADKKKGKAAPGAPKPYQIPGYGVDESTRGLLDQINESNALNTAIKTGGKQAEDAVRRQQEAIKAVTEDYKKWGTEQGNTYAKTYKLADAAKLTNSEIIQLSRNVGNMKPTNTLYNDTVEKQLQQLIALRNQAQLYQSLGQDKGNIDENTRISEEASEQKDRVAKLVQEAKAQRDIAAATKVSAQARRDAEDQAKAAGAVTDEKNKGTPEQRQAIGVATLNLSHATENAQRVEAVQTLKQQVTDTQRQSQADAEGAHASALMAAQIKLETAARTNLLGATKDELAMEAELIRRQDIGKINTSVEALRLQASDTEALAGATLQGKVAIEQVTTAQKAKNDVDKTTLQGLDAQNAMYKEVIALRSQDAANADLEASKSIAAMQEQIDMTNGQIVATKQGAAALREYNIWMAGQAAVNHLAAGTSVENTNAVRALAEAEARAQQQLQQTKSEEKIDMKPITDAFNGMQQYSDRFFNDFLNKGRMSFSSLWKDMKETFIKSLSDMMSNEMTQTVKNFFTKAPSTNPVSVPRFTGQQNAPPPVSAQTVVNNAVAPQTTPNTALGSNVTGAVTGGSPMMQFANAVTAFAAAVSMFVGNPALAGGSTVGGSTTANAQQVVQTLRVAVPLIKSQVPQLAELAPKTKSAYDRSQPGTSVEEQPSTLLSPIKALLATSASGGSIDKNSTIDPTDFATYVSDFHTLVTSPVGQNLPSNTPAALQFNGMQALGSFAPQSSGPNGGGIGGGGNSLTGMFAKMFSGVGNSASPVAQFNSSYSDLDPDQVIPQTSGVDSLGGYGGGPNVMMGMENGAPAAPPVQVSAPTSSLGIGSMAGIVTGGFAIGNAADSAKLGSVGDVALGTLGGAAQGAMVGAQAGPAGALIGGIIGAGAGLIGSLTGLGSAAKAAAEALKDAQQAFYASTTQYTEQITGSNLQTKVQTDESAAGSLYAQGKKADWSQNDPNNAGLQNLENIANQTPQQQQQMYTTLESEGKTQQQVADEIQYAQTVVTELREAIVNATNDYVDGMKDSIQQITTGVGGDSGALQQAKEQEETNIASADAITNTTQKQQALNDAMTLYADQVAQITLAQKLAIQAQASAIQQFQTNDQVIAAQAENNTGLANSLQFAAQQAQTLEQAIQQWSQTNPQLITQLEQVQALQLANYNAQIQQQADYASDALNVRAANATGQTNLAATLQMQLSQAQEMQQAVSQWASTNPQLITQLQQIQLLEQQQLTTQQQQQLQQTQGSLEATALQAEGFTQQADILNLQLQQTAQLYQMTQEWGQSNPALIAQLKQVQAIQLEAAEQQLSNSETNAAAGYKVAQDIYQYSGTGNINTPLPGTGTETPVLGTIPGQVQYEPTIPGITLAPVNNVAPQDPNAIQTVVPSTPGDGSAITGAGTTATGPTTVTSGVTQGAGTTGTVTVTGVDNSASNPQGGSAVTTDTSDESPTDFLSMTELPPVLTFFNLSTLPPVLDYFANGVAPTSTNAPANSGSPLTPGTAAGGATTVATPGDLLQQFVTQQNAAAGITTGSVPASTPAAYVGSTTPVAATPGDILSAGPTANNLPSTTPSSLLGGIATPSTSLPQASSPALLEAMNEIVGLAKLPPVAATAPAAAAAVVAPSSGSKPVSSGTSVQNKFGDINITIPGNLSPRETALSVAQELQTIAVGTFGDSTRASDVLNQVNVT